MATVIIVAMVLAGACYLVPLYARHLSREEEDHRHWATSHQPWKLREPWELKAEHRYRRLRESERMSPREEGPHGPGDRGREPEA